MESAISATRTQQYPQIACDHVAAYAAIRKLCVLRHVFSRSSDLQADEEMSEKRKNGTSKDDSVLCPAHDFTLSNLSIVLPTKLYLDMERARIC